MLSLLVLAGLAPAQAPRSGRTMRAPEALNRALEMQRQDELDKAAEYLKIAQAQSATLTPTERQELRRLTDANRAAAASRKQAQELLAETESAVRDGRTVLARANCRRLLAASTSLSVPDRARLNELCRDLGVTPAPQGGRLLARSKVQQARSQLDQGNLDAAEQLAREADDLSKDFSVREDRPAKILEEIEHARKDPKTLLNASRAALKEGDLDRAEKLADDAQKNAGTFTFPLWSDSPSKVKKDVQAARAHKDAENAPKPEPVKEAAKEKDNGGMFAPVKNLFSRKPEKKEPAKPEEKVAETVKPVVALEPSKPAPPKPAPPKPREKEEAVSMKFDPQLMLPPTPPPAVPSRVEKTAAVPTPPPAVNSPGAERKGKASSETEEARQLVAAGRAALEQGDLEKATLRADQARALKPDLAYWEDTPERLLYSISRARRTAAAPTPREEPVARQPERKVSKTSKPRSQAEARNVLREGRTFLAEGKYDEASEKASVARSYGGKWGLFEDTPDKLLNDLVKARAKTNKDESARVLKEARRALNDGDFDKAQQLTFKAEQLHGPYTLFDLGERPATVLEDIQAAREKKNVELYTQRKEAQKKAEAVARQSKPKPKPTPEVQASKPAPQPEVQVRRPEPKKQPEQQFEPPQKQIALQLMAQARALQAQDKLGDARQKLNEAQALRAEFRPDELSPEQMQLELASLAFQRSGMLVQQAVQVAQYGQGPPAQNYQQAEAQIRQARVLTEEFGQDVSLIDQHLTWVGELKAHLAKQPATAAVGQGVPGAPLPGATAKADDSPRGRGLMLLEKSRLELRKGSLQMARTLAEQAFAGPFNVKREAEQRLREIDIEDHNQKKLTARSTADAGFAAFARQDFLHARNILVTVRPTHLDERRQVRLREIMASPEMSQGEFVAAQSDLENAKPPITRVQAGEGGKKGEVESIASKPGAAGASVGDDFEGDIVRTTKAMQNIRFQALTDESLKVQREAGDRFRGGDAEGAVAMLQDFILKLPEAQLDGEKLGMLRRPVESRIQKYKLMTAQVDIDRQAGAKKPLRAQDVQIGIALNEANKQKHVASLMKQFNDYHKQGKYKEAEMYARMVHEIDPDNPVATAAINVSKNMARLQETKELKKAKEEMFYQGMRDADDQGPYTSIRKPIEFDSKMAERTRGRKDISNRLLGKPKSTAVRQIESKLEQPVNLNFTDTPLRQAVDDLRNWQGINIVIDTAALDQRAISQDRPITLKLEQVSLKSALNILLSQVDLTWVIRDDVLQVTTKENAKAKLEQRTFQVTDLVIPVPDYPLNPIYDHAENLRNAVTAQGGAPGRNNNTPTPGVPGGTPVSSMAGSAQTGSNFAASANGTSPGATSQNGTGQFQIQKGGPSNAVPQHLITLITNTIAPDSWSVAGGPATIDYFPLAMTLVINQTPDIQEQIQDLLQQLRRLQDQSVALEIRLISLSDAFFERMGVDFDLKIKTDRNTDRFEPLLTSGQFKPPGYINDFNPSRFVAGITPAGQLTRDLDIPINATSFEITNPPFGPQQAFAAGATGGLNLGLAFLSDIQVFFFLEAAQGDQRANIMQAPKMTLFNGQTATLNVVNNQFFVTGVRPDFSIPGAPVFFPIIQVFSPGVTITLQAVITGDRRFVRINVANVSLINLVSPNVALFPLTVPVRPVFDGIGAVGEPTLLTLFLQQPVFNVITMQTTVVVPDGGTVLVGGLKRLSEGRSEFGPPILSKIPWLSRLYKNVGYGRESENILLMVTPRIIITEEEEISQTGVISNPALVQ